MRGSRRERRGLQQDVADLKARLGLLDASNQRLKAQLAAQTKVEANGLAPIALRILKSVYTIEAGSALGSAWVAWRENGNTYLITANHVINDVGVGGTVTVKQKTSHWTGEVTRADDTNDLAVIEVDRKLGAPLWQDATVQTDP